MHALYLVKVPDLEHGLPIMERVFKEAVSGWESKILTAQDSAIRKHKTLQEIEVMLSHRVTDINRTTRDGPGCGMECSTRVCGLEHVPIWLNEVAHPKTVVRAVNHMAALEPKGAVGIPRGISAPKVIPNTAKRDCFCA